MSRVKTYKILLAGAACHGGTAAWGLPRGSRPGVWMPRVSDVAVCERGYHLVPAAGVLEWLTKPGVAVYEAEGRGASQREGNKTAYAQARLVRCVMTPGAVELFAADCAAMVLHHFERQRPADARVRLAIETRRAFGRGEARDAAWAAARAAARDAARDAAWDAAWDAARDASLAAIEKRLRLYLRGTVPRPIPLPPVPAEQKGAA